MAITARGFNVAAHRADAKCSSQSPPSDENDYKPASYVALVMKRLDDTYDHHGGLPNEQNLCDLNIPIPPNLRLLASYRIPYGGLPHIAGLDETGGTKNASANKQDKAYHGFNHPYKKDDVTEHGTPVIGGTDQNYDIFVLIYG